MKSKETPKSVGIVLVCVTVIVISILGIGFFFLSKIMGQAASQTAANPNTAQEVIETHKDLQCRLCGKTMQPAFIEYKHAAIKQAGSTRAWTGKEGNRILVISFSCPGCGLVENFSSLK